MKATLATLACLLTVGFLSAAEVTGNNTAVVIRKEVVKSSNGYQFLCVPVNGLNISGAETGTIKLATMLPPATLPVNTTVTIGQATYTNNGTAWTVPGTPNATEANPDLEGGTIFWLNTDVPSVANLFAMGNSGLQVYSSSDNPVVFCGQQRTREVPNWNTLEKGSMTALKNDSSVAITLDQAAALQGEEVRTNDQILTIKAGTSDYKSYYYRNGVWKTGSGIAKPVTDAVIAPGEAFYYYKAITQ